MCGHGLLSKQQKKYKPMKNYNLVRTVIFWYLIRAYSARLTMKQINVVRKSVNWHDHIFFCNTKISVL